jgi:hypothetical protein
MVVLLLHLSQLAACSSWCQQGATWPLSNSWSCHGAAGAGRLLDASGAARLGLQPNHWRQGITPVASLPSLFDQVVDACTRRRIAVTRAGC